MCPTLFFFNLILLMALNISAHFIKNLSLISQFSNYYLLYCLHASKIIMSKQKFQNNSDMSLTIEEMEWLFTISSVVVWQRLSLYGGRERCLQERYSTSTFKSVSERDGCVKSGKSEVYLESYAESPLYGRR